MPDYQVLFHGWDNLNIVFDEFALKNQQFINDLLFQFGNVLLTSIRANAPRDKGEYANSWQILNQGSDSIKIGSTADPRLFIILEFTGARPHLIEGNPILHFMIGEEEFFLKSVQHPGMKAIPHFRPAIEDLKSRANNIVYETMGRHFTLMKEESLKFVDVGRPRGARNIGRSSADETPNIGRGTKGKITAQLTSRKTFKKRIRISGTRRVGTSVKFTPRR